MSRLNIHLIAEILKIQPSFNFVSKPVIVIFLSNLSFFAIFTITFDPLMMKDNNAFAQNTTQEDILYTSSKINTDTNSVTFAPLTDCN